MDNKLIQKLVEEDLFSSPSEDEIKSRLSNRDKTREEFIANLPKLAKQAAEKLGTELLEYDSKERVARIRTYTVFQGTNGSGWEVAKVCSKQGADKLVKLLEEIGRFWRDTSYYAKAEYEYLYSHDIASILGIEFF